MPIFVIAGEDTLAKQNLATLLKELRGSATQRQFAQSLGTSYTSIQDWEKQIRLPSDKNLKRIAQFKGWSFEELILFLFGNDAQSIIATTESLEIITACIKQLSLTQMQQLNADLTVEITEISDLKDKIKQYNLSIPQKHNLHLLLRASLRQQDPLEAIKRAGIETELFSDIFLRDAKDRHVGYEELEKFSSLCYQVIDWNSENFPEINPHRTYSDKIEALFNDLLGVSSSVLI